MDALVLVDKSPSFGQQGGWAVDNHSSRAQGCSGWRVCLSRLPCPLNNSKLSWYLTLHCQHLCSYAESR